MLCLLASSDLRPLTGKAPVEVLAVGRRGGFIRLQTPFIDGCHVLMDTHNITPKLLEVTFSSAGPGGETAVLARAVSYRRCEGPEPPGFMLEVAWVEPRSAGGASPRSLGSLLREIRKTPAPRA